MLKALFSGRMDVKTDDDGWVLLDRPGKHFNIILNFLRDGSVPLPESRQELEELLVESRFYCLERLRQICEEKLEKVVADTQEKLHAASIIIVKYPKITKAIFDSTKKPIVKLTMNRYNNVFSYTTNSHDNLLRNIECLEKYALMFIDRVVFIKDVRDKCEQNEICEWGFYWRCHKLKSLDCIAIHYSSEKRLIKVEFPESRIHEEMLFLLSISDRDLSDAEILDNAMSRGTGISLANQPSQPTAASSLPLEAGDEVINARDSEGSASLLDAAVVVAGDSFAATGASRSAPMFPPLTPTATPTPSSSQAQSTGSGGSAPSNGGGGGASRGPFSGGNYRLGGRR